MNLGHIYKREGPAGLRKIAAITGSSEQYLYQLATGRRTPSAAMARRLVAADARLDLLQLLQAPAQSTGTRPNPMRSAAARKRGNGGQTT